MKGDLHGRMRKGLTRREPQRAIHSLRNLRPHVALLGLFSIAARLPCQSWPKVALSTPLRIDAQRHDLTHVSFIAIDRMGRVAIGQGQDRLIRFFSEVGAPLETFCAAGEGPGEFRELLPNGGWVGDTLWVADRQLQRVTLIGPDHRLLRVLRWAGSAALSPVSAGVHEMTAISVRGVGRGDTLIGAGLNMGQPKGAPSGIIARMTPDGKWTSTIASFGGAAHCLATNVPGGEWPWPFCSYPGIAISPIGDMVATTSASLSQQNRGAFTVTALGTSGNILYTRELEVPTDRLTLQAYDDSLLHRPGVTAANISGIRKTLVVPTRYPVASSRFFGRDGTLWIESAGADSYLWVLVDTKGRPAGMLRVPRNVHLLAADRSTVWGTEVDESGFENVVGWHFMLPQRQ